MGSLPTSSTLPLSIAILGGGVAGLSLALGLQHHAPHLTLHLYESKPQFSELGAALSMLPNAIAALTSMGPETERAMRECVTGSVVAGQTEEGEEEEPARIMAGTGPERGRILGHMLSNSSWKESAVRNVHRATFLGELAKGLSDKVRVGLGKKAVGVRQREDGGMEVEFVDGAVEVFDAVVGADGIHSVVRKSMFDGVGEGWYREPVFSHQTVHRGLVTMEEAVAVFGNKIAGHPTFAMGPGTVLYQYPTDLGRKVNMVVMAYHEDPWEQEAWIVPGTRQELEVMLKDWGEIGQHWVQLLDRPGLAKWAIHETTPLPYYAKGCVAITGDAAHAMNPMAGSGAGQAFEDMAVLTALFTHVHSKEQIPKAFKAYDLARRARAQMTVRSATEMMMKGTFQVPGTTNTNVVDRLYGTINSVVSRDIEDQNRQAVKLFWET